MGRINHGGMGEMASKARYQAFGLCEASPRWWLRHIRERGMGYADMIFAIIYFFINFLMFVSLSTLVFLSYVVVTSKKLQDVFALLINLVIFYVLYWLKFFMET
jgi:hypothetical protein